MNDVDELGNICAARVEGPDPVVADVGPEALVPPALVPPASVPEGIPPLPAVAVGASFEDDTDGASTEVAGASGVEVATEVDGTF